MLLPVRTGLVQKSITSPVRTGTSPVRTGNSFFGYLAIGHCTIRQRVFDCKYFSCKICFNVLHYVFILFIFSLYCLENIQQHYHNSSHCDWRHHIVIFIIILTNSGSYGKIKFTLEYLIFLKLLINMMISVLPMNLLTTLVRFLFVVSSLILTSLLTLTCTAFW